MRTNAGADWQAQIMGNAAAAGAGTGTSRAADYVALTESATAPAATDTTLAGELTTSGLARKQATYAHTAGTSSYSLTATFTSGDAITRTIAKVGIFNASAAGTLVFEALISPTAVVALGDVYTFTQTVTT